jgi:peptidoglycan hydrolase CwlO-like protein
MILESEVAQLQEQIDDIRMQRAQLWEEMRQLKEQFGVSKADLFQTTIIYLLACFP